MPVYAYKSVDASGCEVCGTMAADTASLGRQMLRERGLRPVQMAAERSRTRGVVGGWFGRERRAERAAELARQLALLLSTGVPLVEALDVLIRQEKGRLEGVLRDVRAQVAGGTALSDALSGHSRWFEAVFCSAVKVGEASGQMDGALRELAAYLQERQTHRSRLRAALAYPALLAVVSTGVVLFLMTYVVPDLLAVLAAAGRTLPASTVMLKALSDFLIGEWQVLVLLGVTGALAGAAALRTRRVRRWAECLSLRVPVFGVLAKKSLIAQFAQVMSLLLRSGVTFTDAVGLSRRAIGHLVLGEELSLVETAVRHGSDIAPALRDSRVFTPLVIHMVNVGQQTGELSAMFVELKQGYETEVRLALGKFTAVLEPLLILVMSGVVGFVVFAVMMPILEVTRTIQ